MPDIAKMLWPDSVAIIGASSDTRGLRGRIVEVMRGHPYAGRVYAVSRREREVQGLAAFPTIGDIPDTVDLAVLIIPAAAVPEELERCGQAGVRAACILSSGFAEEPGETGARLQREVQRIARHYGMAVAGPNGEGFANTAAALCPTFSPAMDASDVPLLPAHAPGQAAIISQSGGMGYAVFDHGRPMGLSFRYVVTTGNEACLETFDFVDYMLDEDRTDVFLILLEDIKSMATFERVAARALREGKPLIVTKLGQSPAGARAVAAHTGADAGTAETYRDVFARHGVIEATGFDDMIGLAGAFLTFGNRLPNGRRVAICTSSGGGGALAADACVAAGLDVPLLDAATRAAIDPFLPSYGTSQNPVDVTAQGIHARGYAEFARLAAQSPEIDGVIVVITGRNPRFLVEDRDALMALARDTEKPILMWSYTRPAEICVSLLAEAGLPLFTDMQHCAHAMRAMADYRATLNSARDQARGRS